MPRHKSKAEPIRVAVVADTAVIAGKIAQALTDSGSAIRPVSFPMRGACDRVRDMHPAVVLLRATSRTFPLASALAHATAHGRQALVVLTPTGSRQSIDLALDSGALVHLVEPVASKAVIAAVRLAVARAQEIEQLRAKLVKTRETIHSRGAVERAKGILMRRLGLTEEEAHRRLQTESRNRNRKLVETAWHVIRADVALASEEALRPLESRGGHSVHL